MRRKLSDNGLKLIKKFEGCRLKAYKDSGGILTIGYGHTGDVKNNMVITQQQADNLLKKDCERFVNHINKYMDIYNFNQNQFDALVSFAFNIGSINQLTNNGKRTLKEISNKIQLYCNCNGKKLKGLYNRRIAEKTLFNKAINTNTNSKINSPINSNKVKNIDNIAKEVIQGKWGNSSERRNKLIACGYDYNKIQKRVNEMLKNKERGE